MLEKIERILSGPCGLDPKQAIIVGVSGGPDSLCLMDVLRAAGYNLIVAHFNHQLRPEAAAEAEAVKEIAAQQAMACVVGSENVQAYASSSKLSIEEAARNLRYRFLFEQARIYKAQAIAVAHTADDQVETVLMHFIRGAGLTGLKGMTYRANLAAFDASIPVIRPLLDVWREETVRYCEEHGLAAHHDASNDSLDFLRNRLRHVLIPALEAYNPRFREAVWRSAQSLAADHSVLHEVVERELGKSLVQAKDDFTALDLAHLSSLSSGLQRNLIRRAVERLIPGQEIVYAVLARAQEFISDPARVRMDLTGGLLLLREGDVLYIAHPAAELPFERWPQMPPKVDAIRMTQGSPVNLPDGWCLVSTDEPVHEAQQRSSRNEDQFQAWLDADTLPAELVLRVRRPGDTIEPLGMEGHSQKISDFFTNAKLPRRARDRWPLLCSGDQVLWIPGYRLAEPYKLKPTSRKAVYLSLTGPSEKGSK